MKAQQVFLFLFLLTVVTRFPLFSQNDYEQGSITLNNGKTLYGEIRDRKVTNTGTKLYTKIRFRDSSGKRKKYSPDDIKGYTIGENEYESLWYHESNVLFITYWISKKGKGDKIFLKVLKKGFLTCYFYEYVDNDSGYIDGYELFKRKNDAYFMRATQGIFGLKKNRLGEYFDDCPVLVKKIENGTIKTPLQVVDYYNNRCIKNVIEI